MSKFSEKHLRELGHECDRVTHSEALSENHDITEELRNREYDALDINTPADWHIKHQKARPKMKTLAKWIKLACTLQILLIIFGMPGYFRNVSET